MDDINHHADFNVIVLLSFNIIDMNKYNIGEKVFFPCNGKICSGTIIQVYLVMIDYTPSNEVRYMIFTNDNTYDVAEDKLFIQR